MIIIVHTMIIPRTFVAILRTLMDIMQALIVNGHYGQLLAYLRRVYSGILRTL